jgi:hypothetical protein
MQGSNRMLKTLAASALLVGLLGSQNCIAGAREQLDASAAALGGRERVFAVKNITLIGSGQSAINQSGSGLRFLPGAPSIQRVRLYRYQ